MAEAWLFASEEMLLVAMKSGLVPANVQGQSTDYWCTEEGAIGVCPSKKIPKAAATALEEAGVARSKAPKSLRAVRHWPALLATTSSGQDDLESVVLFASKGEVSLFELLAELIRLGCDRCSFQVFDSPGQERLTLVRAYDPPYYSVALAADSDTRRYQVYVPALEGLETLWIERGRAHPAVLGLITNEEGLELISADDTWRALPKGTWTDALTIVDVKLPAIGREFKPVSARGRLQIPLHFTKTNREGSPSFWIIKSGGAKLIDELVATMPDDVVDQLLFAVVTPVSESAKPGALCEPCVLLRARVGRGKVAELGLPIQGSMPLMGIGNLYVPSTASVEPPLRRDTLRELLASDADRVYWLSRDAKDEGLVIDSVAESEFSPLSEWVDYVIQDGVEVLESWVRSSIFSFESFQSTGQEWDEIDSTAKEPRNRSTERSEERAAVAQSVQVAEGERKVSSAKVQVPAAASRTKKVKKVVLSEVEKRLASLEADFLTEAYVEDDPTLPTLWAEMAQLHGQLSNRRDSTLCWTRAMWELPWAQAGEVAARWVTHEIQNVGPLTETITSKELPLAIATWIRAAATETQPSANLQRSLPALLDLSEGTLDVRTLWLANVAMSKTAGGDPLLLARSRDKLLRRLRNGLSLANDVPTFLRFAGGDADREAVQQLSSNLETLWAAYQKTKRKRSALEAPEAKTKALVGLEFSFGFASLGMQERADSLREESLAKLVKGDQVEAFLASAYEARIDQALQGVSRETALPPAIAATLSSLSKLDRYKVDRLREASTVLEPQERLDPVEAFQRGGDSRGKEFSELRGLEDPANIVAAIDEILSLVEAKDTSVEDRGRLLDGVMDFFSLIPEADAVPALRRVLLSAATTPPARQALLLEEAMSLTGFFGRDEMTEQIASDLSALVGQLAPDEAIALASEFGSCLRGLRRVGLSEQAADLLDRLGGMSQGNTPDLIEARLHIAAGQAYIGDFDRAQVILTEAQEALGKLKLTNRDRLRIAKALAGAWSQAPRAEAIAGLTVLSKQLPLITDSFNTNSHFCLSIVSFMDVMVLALASEDLALGEMARRWLDEDEYFIRRRIHRDMGVSR